jgi:beta-lactam-binding protein with PASTA domain
MVGVIAALAALLALLAWFFWPSADVRPPVRRTDVDDEAELEQAEREVQEAPDEETVRDWGPGVQKPPI